MFMCDEALVTTRIDAAEFQPQKVNALRAHRSQLDVDSGFFQLLQHLDEGGFGIEFYRLVKGTAVVRAAEAVESDLFAGVTA